MYEKFFKRLIDFLFSLLALLVLLPLLMVLMSLGAVFMKGNPFFTQERPGRHEKIFRLVKFRTMTNERDISGELLPDEVRLNHYGTFLRATSLDELPELINILAGHMALVGPRPLLVEYLPWYTAEQRHRHDVRPGLTGYAQVHGRNLVDWDERFRMDVEYTQHITFSGDAKILLATIQTVIRREGISSGTAVTMEDYRDYCRMLGREPTVREKQE